MLRTYNFVSVKPPKTDKKTEKLYRKSLKLSVSRIKYPTKHDKTLQEPTMKTDNVNTSMLENDDTLKVCFGNKYAFSK